MSSSARGELLVIGCGNPLRGDDGVGPEVVRRLAARGVPHVRCIDAGTSGVDVVLAMRDHDEVVIVDACRSGAAAGTIRERAVAPDGGGVPDPAGPPHLTIHAFRWDHAVALGRSLLGAAFPGRVTAVLVEGACFEPGDALSPATAAAVDEVVARLVAGRAERHGSAAPRGPEEGMPEASGDTSAGTANRVTAGRAGPLHGEA
jgi:hydrogenase maturation protease